LLLMAAKVRSQLMPFLPTSPSLGASPCTVLPKPSPAERKPSTAGKRKFVLFICALPINGSGSVVVDEVELGLSRSGNVPTHSVPQADMQMQTCRHKSVNQDARPHGSRTQTCMFVLHVIATTVHINVHFVTCDGGEQSCKQAPLGNQVAASVDSQRLQDLLCNLKPEASK
jgi:hypothetical protein